MTLAAMMHLIDRNVGITGLSEIGNLFFLIATVSFLMKKYLNKK